MASLVVDGLLLMAKANDALPEDSRVTVPIVIGINLAVILAALVSGGRRFALGYVVATLIPCAAYAALMLFVFTTLTGYTGH